MEFTLVGSETPYHLKKKKKKKKKNLIDKLRHKKDLTVKTINTFSLLKTNERKE